MDYHCVRNPLNLGVDPIENGRMAAILALCHNIYIYVLEITYFHGHSVDGAFVVGLGGGMSSIECTLVVYV